MEPAATPDVYLSQANSYSLPGHSSKSARGGRGDTSGAHSCGGQERVYEPKYSLDSGDAVQPASKGCPDAQEYSPTPITQGLEGAKHKGTGWGTEAEQMLGSGVHEHWL
jgi:hypothetical protein